MRCVGIHSGGFPVLRRLQVAATITRPGVPHLAVVAGTAGLAVATTTGAVNMVGINLDLATYGTAQVAGSSPEALATFITNPDAVWEIDMSGGAASLVAETQKTVTTATTTGLTITTADSWTAPERDEGSIWGISGANAGQIRKITSTSATAATVTVAFAADDAVGDLYGWAPISSFTLQTLTLTTELDEFRQDVAVATNTAEFLCINVPVGDWLSGNASYPKRPFIRAIARFHMLNPTA